MLPATHVSIGRRAHISELRPVGNEKGAEILVFSISALGEVFTVELAIRIVSVLFFMNNLSEFQRPY